MEFDPLNYHTIADTVISALLKKSAEPMPVLEKFPGAGVYMIYYNGGFELYRPIVNTDVPIYVGKAIPSGSRRGIASQTKGTSPQLHKRLREHSQSLDAAKNLDVAGFKCRYLVVTPVWIGIAESLLIQKFNPVWNAMVDGFGLHFPGKTRFTQKRSDWDTLHPGRRWEPLMKPGKPVEEIKQAVRAHFAD